MPYKNLLCTHVHKVFLQLMFLENALATEGKKKPALVTVTAFVNII